MSALGVRDVSKSFRVYSSRPRELKEVLALRRREFFVVKALDHVSFEVAPGRMIGIIGRNGAGKSTLLKILVGVLQPDGGSVFRSGRVAALLELGAGFHPEFTGLENIFLYAAVLGLDRRTIAKRVDAIVAFGELERFIHLPLRVYSSGMQARLGFAVAIHTDATCLVVDEVLAVGDAAFQSRCLESIAAFRGKGGTILWVTHDAETVRRMCDTAVWLDLGRVRAIGEPREVVSQYLTLSAAAATAPSATAEWERTDVSSDATVARAWWDPPVTQVGASATLHIELLASQIIDEANVGFALYGRDGQLVSGASSTAQDGMVIGTVIGHGAVRVDFPAVGLVPGAYVVDIGVQDGLGRQVAYQKGATTLLVQGPCDSVGVAAMGPRWTRIS